MLADIIAIGDEILVGQIVESNSTWIANQLNLMGMQVRQITTISDSEEHILEALNRSSEKSDLVILTGGLGPTKDDITKSTLCQYFGSELIFNEEAFRNIKIIFEGKGAEILDINKAQAELPENCTPLQNNLGTAPGMWFEENNTTYVSLPGVPYEMKYLMKAEVLPRLQKSSQGAKIVHRTIMTTGIGESRLSTILDNFESSLPSNYKLAYLPRPGIVRLRLTCTEEDNLPINAIDDYKEQLISEITEYVYGLEDEKLEEAIGKLLLNDKSTLTTAESCTGGYISHLITSISGSSNYFVGSIVSYSNDIKEGMLEVGHDTLDKNGAVSEQVVREMAENAKRKFSATYSIATTGIAGPTGGTKEKPVGTVWIAVSGPETTDSKLFRFNADRERNIERSAYAALNLLRKMLLK
ncbi:competence/damage-inducible protein A [bacterium AH-315-C07]|nr:competence/damage-inducible protein A [bacterium AH-315-C07]